MIDKHKYLLASILLLFIIIMGMLMYINRDTMFLHRVIIEYGDGCKEVLENGILTTPECTEGRRLEAEYNGRIDECPQWINKLNLTNLTYQR